MNNSGKVEASKVDSYLTQVRAALHGLPEGQVDDILRELRGHALELAEAKGVEAALNSLGDPVDLAKTYRAENQIIQGECSGSPLAILLGLRHASRSRAGRLLGTVLYVFGYTNVLTLWVAAVDKLFWPSRTGLWVTSTDWRSLELVTNGNPPAGTREVLGWWLIPAAILAGWILRYFIDRVARWWLRRYRHSKSASQLVTRAN
jgi:hypothetical protein